MATERRRSRSREPVQPLPLRTARQLENVEELVTRVLDIWARYLGAAMQPGHLDGDYLVHLAMEHPSWPRDIRTFHNVWIDRERVENKLGLIQVELGDRDGGKTTVHCFSAVKCAIACFPDVPLVLPPLEEDIEQPLVIPRDTEIPPFSNNCHGGPNHWNQAGKTLWWGKRAKAELIRMNRDRVTSVSTKPDVNSILKFLDNRCGVHKLCRPDYHFDGWYRLQWKELPDAEMKLLRQQGWKRAWHGTKLEALYSIVETGYLTDSLGNTPGQRVKGHAPGVYVHGDATHKKANYYAPFMDIFGDGVMWAVKFELLVERRNAAPRRRGREQWVITSDAVKIAALWICGRTPSEMRNNSPLTVDRWDPLMEANPFEGCRA